MGGLRHLVQSQVVLEFGDDFSDIAHQATINGEGSAWEGLLQLFDSVEYPRAAVIF